MGVVASAVGGNPEMLPEHCLVDAADAPRRGRRPGRPGPDSRTRVRDARRLADRGRHVLPRIADVYDTFGERDEPPRLPVEPPDRTIERAAEADREIRITDFVLMAILVLRSENVGPVPLNELTMAALVGLCLLRPARGGARLPAAGRHAPRRAAGAARLLGHGQPTSTGPAGSATWPSWLASSGQAAPAASRCARRASASRPDSSRSAWQLAASAATPPRSSHRLPADPNAGAYFIVVLGILAIFFCDDRWKVRSRRGPDSAGLVLSYSRTGLLAGAFAVVWVLVGRRLGLWRASPAGGVPWSG